jgi:hypothetical protein
MPDGFRVDAKRIGTEVAGETGWQRRFDDPIPLSKGKKLATLRDAALYITKLPKAEHDAEE